MATEPKAEPASAAEKPARRLRRDAEENRRRLLEAAREVFAEAGFEATMDEIASRAGVGVGTAYRRFANKEELIGALFADRLDELEAVIDAALAEPDPWRGIVTYLERSVALQSCDRGLKELVLSSQRHREFVEAARARLMPRVERLVRRASDAGALRPGVEMTDLVMVQLMLGAITDSGPDGPAEAWRRYLPLLLDGLGAERSGPLPGSALTLTELDQVMEAKHRR
ncbi:MAG: helix-turn-helix domain-containing protein [Solirubrobacterales bacterium]